MPMTLDQIVEEAGHLPIEQVVELVDRLSQGLHLSPGIEESWKAETRRRVADIEVGKVHGIARPEVSARIRKVVGRFASTTAQAPVQEMARPDLAGLACGPAAVPGVPEPHARDRSH
jgi:putative addiction module component (TIGR02574 family)